MTLGSIPTTKARQQPGLISTPRLQSLTSFSAATRSEQGGSTYGFLGYKQKGHYRIFFSEAPQQKGTWSSSETSSCSRSYLNCCPPALLVAFYGAVLLSFDPLFHTLPSPDFFYPEFQVPSYILLSLRFSLRSSSLPSSNRPFLSQYSR